MEKALMDQARIQELSQHIVGESREFILEPNRLHTYCKNENGETEEYFRYEIISSTRRRYSRQNGNMRSISILFAIVAVIELLLSIFIQSNECIGFAILLFGVSVILFSVYLLRKRSFIILDLLNSNKSIMFLANKPSAEQLDKFLASLFIARNQYLRHNYFESPSDISRGESLARLKWLLQENVITQIEYESEKAIIEANRKIDHNE